MSTSMGQSGADWIDNTTVLTGDWAVIQAITDTVFAAMTCSTISINGGAVPATWATKAITAGTVLYGRFTSITLTSGSVVAYRATTY